MSSLIHEFIIIKHKSWYQVYLSHSCLINSRPSESINNLNTTCPAQWRHKTTQNNQSSFVYMLSIDKTKRDFFGWCGSCCIWHKLTAFQELGIQLSVHDKHIWVMQQDRDPKQASKSNSDKPKTKQTSYFKVTQSKSGFKFN